MKKLQFRRLLAGALITGVLVLGACDRGQERLYVYNWTYYVPDETIEAFEQEFNVRVVYDTYASNEEMFAKLKAGGDGYDVVFPSGDYVSIMIAEGMVLEIDRSKVPNYENIDPAVLLLTTYDPGNRYSVPYVMGAAGIAINANFVDDWEESWSVFNRADLSGRITLLDDMREVLGAALRSLGYSVNSLDPVELDEAKAVVLGWRENIVRFDAETFGKGFAAGEFHVVHGYAENVFIEFEDLDDSHVEFFIPAEGGPMYMDSMVILKGARNPDLAHAFIDFIHRPEVYAEIADFLAIPPVNVPARELTTEQPVYGFDALLNSEFIEDVGDGLALYNRIWQEIRAGY